MLTFTLAPRWYFELQNYEPFITWLSMVKAKTIAPFENKAVPTMSTGRYTSFAWSSFSCREICVMLPDTDTLRSSCTELKELQQSSRTQMTWNRRIASIGLESILLRSASPTEQKIHRNELAIHITDGDTAQLIVKLWTFDPVSNLLDLC